MQGLEGVFVEDQSYPIDLSMLEYDQAGLIEVVLSPHSVLSGITLSQMNFREKYGLTVLAECRTAIGCNDSTQKLLSDVIKFSSQVLLTMYNSIEIKLRIVCTQIIFFSMNTREKIRSRIFK